jgi:hypothetical protein
MNTDEFRVPSWLIGSLREVEVGVESEAREWAASWRTSQRFPVFELSPIGDSAMVVYSSSDNDPNKSMVRLFANDEFVPTMMRFLNYPTGVSLYKEYERHVSSSPWGSFEALTRPRPDHDMQSTGSRLRHILPHLPVLSSTYVVDSDSATRSAALLIDRHISTTLQNWGADEASSLRSRIHTALTEMDRASTQTISDRIVTSMPRLIPRMQRLRNPNVLAADRIRQSLTAMGPAEYDNLTCCTDDALRSELYTIDRSIRDGRSQPT